MDRSPSEPYTFDMIHQTNVSVDSSDIGLQPRWKAVLIEWAQLNGSVRELWLFGSRGPKGGATVASDVDIGLALCRPTETTIGLSGTMPPCRRTGTPNWRPWFSGTSVWWPCCPATR